MAVDKRPYGSTEPLDPDFGVQRIRDAAEAAESAAAVVAADLSAHEAAPDPHPGYVTGAEVSVLKSMTFFLGR